MTSSTRFQIAPSRKTMFFALLLSLLVSTGNASPIRYIQEEHQDGSVTTTASDNSGAVHDQTREQGQQTKNDLNNQGYEVVAKSFRIQETVFYVPRHECDFAGDGTAENCPPPKHFDCKAEQTCEGRLPFQCLDVMVCRPTIIED
jgi:hypothetical protein